MKATTNIGTGFYEYAKAVEFVNTVDGDDDWTYVVVDCKNGLGRIDVYDEDNDLVVKGFIL